MKVCIVTVYNSQNCGSFLQAYALGKALERSGVDTCYYRIKNNERKRLLKLAFRSFLKLDFRGFCCAILQPKKFNKAYSLLEETTDKTLPLYILGSDTIWDVHTASFLNNFKYFWGVEFSESRVFSYAPSIGNSDEVDFSKVDSISEALDHMSSISVRENKAKLILEYYTDKDISVICDPTLLLDAEEYCQIAQHPGEDCILVYYYGKVPESYINVIESISEQYNIRTISFGSSNKWCDVIEPYDPIRFIELYNSARYVITNTFHGTVFSHIFHKKFVVIGNKKNKINDFLDRMGTLNKIANSSEDIIDILNSDYNYNEIDRNISKEREVGLDFLNESLKKCFNE